MFKQAKKWKFIDINPHEEATKPKLTKKKRNFYNNEQVVSLLNCLQSEDIKVRTLITLALDSGIKRSELCAIRWGDEEKAKTEYSVRTIDLSVNTINLLKEYKILQDEYITKMGAKWLGTD